MTPSKTTVENKYNEIKHWIEIQLWPLTRPQWKINTMKWNTELKQKVWPQKVWQKVWKQDHGGNIKWNETLERSKVHTLARPQWKINQWNETLDHSKVHTLARPQWKIIKWNTRPFQSTYPSKATVENGDNEMKHWTIPKYKPQQDHSGKWIMWNKR